MEEQIQRFCLNLIKKLIIITLLFVCYLIYFFNFKVINKKEMIININKGSDIKTISNLVFSKQNNYESFLYYIFLRLWNNNIDKINYGEFLLEKDLNLLNITHIISNPSNVFYKFAIIDGWQEYQINNLISNRFKQNIKLNYNEILADTYNYRSTDTLDDIINLMKKNRDQYFLEKSKNLLLKKYTENEIMTIASLVEKEGLDYNDKRIISSVIFNRLNKKMKLQIDASTIFSITKGKYKFEKKLLYKDLEIINDFNTYYINGLPPNPICFVSRKTIDIILENYKSDYLFYFFNQKLNKHVYSITFEEHKKKLKEYRKNEK